MPIDKSQHPYYDDYNADKQYSQLLAVPGNVEQAREFTQIQSLVFDFMRRISDSLFKEGDIISGMGFNIDSDNSTITITKGQVYLAGRVHVFQEQTIPFDSEGVEIIGVTIEESIVDYQDDDSLLDPALGEINYGQPGADRIKSVPVLTMNDSTSSSIYEFTDGLLKVQTNKPKLDALRDVSLTDVMAQRTYEESGNYRVTGFDIGVDDLDENNIQIVLEPGIAYVEGYRIVKPTPTKVVRPISKAVKSIGSEPKLYQSGTNTYQLNHTPSAQIHEVVAVVEVTDVMTRGGVVDGLDYLPNTSVVSIESITDATNTYVEGTDFSLSQDGVDWGLSGLEPNPGASYTVVYRYNKTLVENTDYDMYSDVDEWGVSTDYVRFLGGDVPVDNTNFTVDYSFYLSRFDLFRLNKEGDIEVTEGGSDLNRNLVPPINTDPSMLSIGVVYFPANSPKAEPTIKTTTRLDMSALQKVAKRLTDVEYNQAITALDREAMEGEPPTELKGVFSDSFRSTFKGDLSHPDFTMGYSLEDGTLLLPPAAIVDNTPVVDANNSDAKMWGRLITAPMIEKISINQPYATTTKKVNPYQAINALGVLKVSPEVDNWINTERIQIEDTETKSQRFYRWWGHPGREAWNGEVMNMRLTTGQRVENWRPAWRSGDVGFVETTEKSRQILEDAITYMRRIEVEIHAEALEPSTDNLELYFDDIKCSLTPMSGYSSGSVTGSVRSNTSGQVKATFTIPEGIKTGTREVVLRNGSNTAVSSFTSIGTKRTIVDKVLTTRITLNPVDPLAQTFQYNRDTIMTSIGAYFSSKEDRPVHVQIRDVVNGYPGRTIYEEKVIQPADIRVSGDATAETKVTFDDPVFCKANTQYCVVYLTDSATTSMYIADLGGNDITTGVQVVNQPYLAGLLFSSSNGLAWTAHQSQNLKFKSYVAEFNETGTIEFGTLTDVGADKILMFADYLTPSNTGCVWEASINGEPYKFISTYEDMDTEEVVDTLKLRAIFKADKNMSPLIAQDSFTLMGFLTEETGTYVSRNVLLDQPYTTVKIGFDAHLPLGCAINVEYTYDGGTTWITPTLTSSNPVSPDFNKYLYEDTVPEVEQATNYRVRLTLTANSSVLRPKIRRLINIMK